MGRWVNQRFVVTQTIQPVQFEGVTFAEILEAGYVELDTYSSLTTYHATTTQLKSCAISS